jgi:hypothetical protein
MLPDVKLSNACDELLDAPSCPTVLWHYTSVEAALGIVATSCLHLSCHAFMNDPAEGTHSVDLVGRCWRAALERVGTHTKFDVSYLGDVVRVFRSFHEYRPYTPPTFLFSLTVLRDSLSQWSRYGADGAGLALGFRIDAARFKPFTPTKEWSVAPFLRKVLYDGEPDPDNDQARQAQSELQEFQSKLIDLLCALLSDVRDPTEADNALLSTAHQLRPVVKRASYGEEQEWRIAARTVEESTSLYELRSNRHGIAPYMKLPFGEAIRLERIMLGPKLSKDNCWSTRWLCRRHGLDVDISQSALAYR